MSTDTPAPVTAADAADPADRSGLRLERLNYGSYLKVPELLALQQELSAPAHHDEMFFIVIHQAAELWFKLMLHETEALIEALRAPSISRALKVLRRLCGVMDLQVRQIGLLATLTPVEFAGFRDHLRPASGFQSAQFRAIEYAYGLRDPFFLKFFDTMPEAHAALVAWRDRPSIADEFAACLRTHAPRPAEQHAGAAASPPDPSGQRPSDPVLLAQLQYLYENPGEHYHWVLLCEGLLDFDERFAQWRAHHVLMVARTIGQKPGTGGSAGYRFLQSRLEHRFFPELWELRTLVGSTPY